VEVVGSWRRVRGVQRCGCGVPRGLARNRARRWSLGEVGTGAGTREASRLAYPSDKEVQTGGCGAAAELTHSVGTETHRLTNSGLCEMVAPAAVGCFFRCEEVQLEASRSLAGLSSTNESRVQTRLLEAGALEAVVAALKWFRHSSAVQREASKATVRLAGLAAERLGEVERGL